MRLTYASCLGAVIATISTGAFSADADLEAMGRAACEYIAQIPAKDRLNRYLLSNVEFDVNHDGTVERVKATEHMGTMGGEALSVTKLDGTPIDYETVGYEWKDYWTHGSGLLIFRGDAYFVHFTDESWRYPSYLSAMMPDDRMYRVCEFENSRNETFLPTRIGKEVCPKLQENGVERIGFNAPANISREALNPPNRFETEAIGFALVDFDNDGRDDPLVELQYSSGAGRGCGLRYFDLVTPDGESIAQTPARDMLLKMQGISFDGRHPGSCDGNTPSWFKSGGMTYFENAPPVSERLMRGHEFHVVSLIAENKIEPVCRGVFDPTAKIKQVFPAP